MAGKLAPGVTGMAVAALLGVAPLYSPSGFNGVSVIAAIACVVTAALFAIAYRDLTPERRSGVSPA